MVSMHAFSNQETRGFDGIMKRAEILEQFALARKGAYALGSFSPRNTVLIDAVIGAAEKMHSPAMVQMSSNEMRWFDVEPRVFADAFRARAQGASVPVILHLDHTYDYEVIVKAVEAGFDSVMIDGSKLPFEENIALTRKVVDYAHAHDVAVEGELGNIGGADKLETGGDTSLYTVPAQALEFVQRTGVDTLAVSVGTAHGVYPTSNPTIDFARLAEIRDLIPETPLVLHGGSGLPMATVQHAIHMDGKGGIAKLNIATDLELIFQRVLHVSRMPNAEVVKLDPAGLAQAVKEVQAFVENRMETYLFSAGKAKQ